MNMNYVWPIWLGTVVISIAVSFGFLEAYAINSGKPTLSRFVWELTASQPWIPVVSVGLLCFVAGFLTCHFWWGGVVSFAPVKTIRNLLQ